MNIFAHLIIPGKILLLSRFTAAALFLLTWFISHAQVNPRYGHQRLLVRDRSAKSIGEWVYSGTNRKGMYNGLARGWCPGTRNGYEEYELATGKKIHELNSYPGALAARRLRNGNTLLTGVNWQGHGPKHGANGDRCLNIHRKANWSGRGSRTQINSRLCMRSSFLIILTPPFCMQKSEWHAGGG